MLKNILPPELGLSDLVMAYGLLLLLGVLVSQYMEIALARKAKKAGNDPAL